MTFQLAAQSPFGLRAASVFGAKIYFPVFP